MGKENFWLDRRSPRDPSRKGEHIRKPYSVAKIISISPGAMPPFTLETHTINAKIKPSLWFNSLHQAPALGLYFTSKNLPMGGWEGRARVSSHSSRYTKRSRVFWSPKLDLSPFSPFLVPHLQASTPQSQRILLDSIVSFLFFSLTPISTQKHIPKTEGRRFYPTHPTGGDFD